MSDGTGCVDKTNAHERDGKRGVGGAGSALGKGGGGKRRLPLGSAALGKGHHNKEAELESHFSPTEGCMHLACNQL